VSRGRQRLLRVVKELRAKARGYGQKFSIIFAKPLDKTINLWYNISVKGRAIRLAQYV
jgi:hypothetical protein